jgi:hypothetical protein
MSQQTPTEDSLDAELKAIIDGALHQCSTRALRSAEVRLDHVSMAKSTLREKLTMYIVNRDHKILQHGINLGKESK